MGLISLRIDVYNGQANKMILAVTNHDSKPYKLNYVSGQFKEVGGKEKPIRNVSLSLLCL